MTDFSTDWIERKTAQLIAVARRSQYRENIFADARDIAAEDGVVMDVALAISLRYWAGDPITGVVPGVLEAR
jgi:hypothetical protein